MPVNFRNLVKIYVPILWEKKGAREIKQVMKCVNTDERLNRSQILSCGSREVGVKQGGETTWRWQRPVVLVNVIDAVVVAGKSEVDRRNVPLGGSVAALAS